MTASRLRRLAAPLLLALLLPGLAAAATTVRIGTSERAGKSSTARNFGPFLKHLNSGGGEFAYVLETYDTPEKLYADFRAKKVDVAILGPVLYVRAHAEIGAIPIAADGGEYHSIVFVREESPIRSLEELRGKSFAFGYADSTSSHLVPLLQMSKVRIKEADLGRHEFVGNHEAVIEAVLAGKFEAGGCIEAAFLKHQGRGLRAIAKSDPIPSIPVVVHADADAAWLADFRRRVLAYKAPSSSPTEPFGRGVFPVTDADYNQVRFLCKVVLGIEFKK